MHIGDLRDTLHTQRPQTQRPGLNTPGPQPLGADTGQQGSGRCFRPKGALLPSGKRPPGLDLWLPHPGTAYLSDGVPLVLPVGPALHLVAVVVRVEDPPCVQVGACPQDGLTVQLQGAHPVFLLYAMAEQLPIRALGPVGQPGVDGECGLPVVHLPEGEARQVGQAQGAFWMPRPSPFFLRLLASPSLHPFCSQGDGEPAWNREQEGPVL